MQGVVLNHGPTPFRDRKPHGELRAMSVRVRCAAGGAGRGGKEGNIIGDVISHGKKHYWLVPGTHYHATLQAGENTLNAQVRSLLSPGNGLRARGLRALCVSITPRYVPAGAVAIAFPAWRVQPHATRSLCLVNSLALRR